MNTKRLGWIVILVSASVGVLLGTIDQVLGGGVRVLVLAWPALGIVLGVLTVAGVKLSDLLQVSDEIQAFPDLIADDLQDLRSGHPRAPVLYGAMTLVGMVIYAFLVVRYQKWYAAWGNISVLLVALLVTAAVAFLGIKSVWFQRRRGRFPARVFIIPAVGLALTLLVGVQWAEPMEYGGKSRMARSQVGTSDQYSASTRSGSGSASVSAVGEVADVGIQFIDLGGLFEFDCDGDLCAVVWLVIILVALVAVLVAASAAVPHFWVVAAMLLLMIMALVTVRELLYYPDDGEYAAG